MLLALQCEHANEMPAVCPCPSDCYCKSHSCRPKSITRAIDKVPYKSELMQSEPFLITRRGSYDLIKAEKDMGCGPKPKWSISIGPNKALGRIVWRKVRNAIT